MAGTLTSTRKITNTAGSQPVLTTSAQINIPKICITIDHLYLKPEAPDNAYKYAKILRDKKIPVTVFIYLTGGGTASAADMEIMKQLHAIGAKLGVHTLEKTPDIAKQDANTDYQIDIISQITGQKPVVASYHGSVLMPFPGNFAAKGIKYIRGTAGEDSSSNRYNTPVAANNAIGLASIETATKTVSFFFHPNELGTDTTKRSIFNQLASGVGSKYYALDYYQAMKEIYG